MSVTLLLTPTAYELELEQGQELEQNKIHLFVLNAFDSYFHARADRILAAQLGSHSKWKVQHTDSCSTATSLQLQSKV